MSDPLAAAKTSSLDGTIANLKRVIAEYQASKAIRSLQAAELQLANEYIKLVDYDEALRILRPLWHSMLWRKEGWWDLAEAVARLLQKTAALAGDGGTVVAVDWELMSSTFPPADDAGFDITKALDNIENIKGRPSVVLRQPDVHSFLVTTFAFDQETARVGEPCRGQLSVTSHAAERSAPIAMDEVKILFETSLKPITIRHKTDGEEPEKCRDGSLVSKVSLTEEQSKRTSTVSTPNRRQFKPTFLAGVADLTFIPGQTRVFEFVIPLRESENARALTASFTMTTSSFDLDYIVSFDSIIDARVYWAKPPSRKRIVRSDPHKIRILPKPPKMDIHFPSLTEQYYTDEAIKIQLDIFNGEDEDTIAELEVEVTSAQSISPATPFTIRLVKSIEAHDKDATNDDEYAPEGTKLGRVTASTAVAAVLEFEPVQFQAVYDVRLLLKYTLTSDPETRISRTSAIRLNVESPFEANYEFSPRQDDRPWPSFFDSEGLTSTAAAEGATLNPTAHGLGQKWSLTARYCSFAREIVAIESVELAINALNGALTCSTAVSATSPELPASIEPEGLGEAHFDVLTQKLSLDDRRSASLDLSLILKWRRADGSDNSVPFNTTTLPMPRLLVASSEPRVLASYTSSPPGSIPFLMHVKYVIENPSMHFLTFSCVMESSDRFAFEGPKSSIVQVLPMSRMTVEYKVMPNVGGEWMGVNLVVTDRYFQKVLRVQAGEGMKGLNERDGVGIWVPEYEDDE